MRYALLVAALLAGLALADSALAFETDTAGNSNPDGSQRYVDPDENPAFGATESSDGSARSGRSTPFGGGVISGYTGSTDSAGPGDQPWLAPRSRAGH
jgi:hypothetical protein